MNFRTAFALATFAALTAHAVTVDDPFPKKIAKSDMRVELKPVASGLASPVHLVVSPDRADRLLVVDQAGTVRVVEGGALREEPFLDATQRLVALKPNFDERGLLSIAFDPGYRDAASPGHRRVFVYTSEPVAGTPTFPFLHGAEMQPDHHAVIASWKVRADGLAVEPSTRVEVMRVVEPQFNHNGGMIAFGPDGYLYIGLGDGGSANDLGPGHNMETGNAQDMKVPLGKMLRIDVNGRAAASGTYGIPKDNPFVKSGGLPEIFALGLRNPWRWAFSGDQLLVGDVGQNKLEMVYRVEAGKNYGWRIKEGTFKFSTTGIIDDDLTGVPPGLTPPVLQYDRDEGTSIIGGYLYRGRTFPALVGKYVFGDYRNGKTFSGRLFFAEIPNGEIRELRIGADDRELGFLLKGIGLDADGELYLCGSAQPGPVGTGGVVVKVIAP
jgi:glucose/arabinose dehydrogenase